MHDREKDPACLGVILSSSGEGGFEQEFRDDRHQHSIQAAHEAIPKLVQQLAQQLGR